MMLYINYYAINPENKSITQGSAQPGRFGAAKKDGLGSTEGWSRRGSADGAPVEHPEVDRWLSSGASSLRSQVTVCRDYTYGKVHAFTKVCIALQAT